ncbi:hypothetical protein L5515_010686 [Caenorhabditis briggsae]|uniref:Uncharacterized protein n=1 Tax=Caenorhabditis briggsae TaxID=6238 RepID=A0AAE9EMS3_CAEBR|nr:hypothetical protein L5515_010686 [Caenorhabditis briggsae]
MESFSNEGSELSELELDELITTKFFRLLLPSDTDSELKPDDVEDEKIETARAVGSPMNLCLSPMNTDHHVILDDSSKDDTVNLLKRIQNASESSLRNVALWDVFEISKKKKNTTRISEMDLINQIITDFDNRPALLHIFCRRLIESDIQMIIGKALLEGTPPTKHRSALRMTIKTDMPLKQLIGQLEHIWNSSPTIELEDAYTTALQKNLNMSNNKYRTPMVKDFAELEHTISIPSIPPMNSSTRFIFNLADNPFITLNVDYHNEVDAFKRRHKTIVIEQLVKPVPGTLPERRVTFGTPLIEKIHEFEIDEGAPFHSLRFKIFNLNEYLESIGKTGGPFGNATLSQNQV